MSTLTAFKFDTPDGAKRMADVLADLQKGQLITIQDGAIVTWPEGKKKPKTHQLVSLTGVGALSGAFWGMLFGLLFFIPFWGMAIGAAMGALTGKFSDYGIDDDFIKSVSAQVTPGTSALFLLVGNAAVDKVADAIKQQDLKFQIISTNLSKEQEQNLREEFGVEEEAAS